jgi:hypothetical protein
MRHNNHRVLAVLIALLCVAAATFSVSATSQAQEKATEISLFNTQSTDNAKFSVGNMFPGDSEEKSFCVKVSHNDSVTVHFGAVVDENSAKLAEVLKVKVTGPDRTVIYNGLIKDLADVKYSLTGSADAELSYTVQAYLDTSVGNEYMEKKLTADLRWWVSDVEVEHLSGGGRGYSKWWYEWKAKLAADNTGGQGTAAADGTAGQGTASADASELPSTGDEFPLVPVAAVVVLSGAGLIFLLCHRKRREGDKNA